jgi:hypothetical protein
MFLKFLTIGNKIKFKERHANFGSWSFFHFLSVSSQEARKKKTTHFFFFI